MMAPRLDWLFGTCSCAGCEGQGHAPSADGQISLNSDGNQFGRQMLTRGDSLDITFSPWPSAREDQAPPPQAPFTPRQRHLRDQLQLPKLQVYPVPPNSEPQDTEEERRRRLLQMYREVALDLHTGMYLTQLTADRDYADIHCQLMEDMTTLKLDQSNGRIIEFPLTNVSKVYRIVKSDNKFYTPGTAMPAERAGAQEHIVVVEFLRRKLAFVFQEVQVAQRFMICIELLIRRAQQQQALRSLTPTFPPRQAQANPAQCPTPRQVYEAMSRGSPEQWRQPPSPGAGLGRDRSL